VEEEEGEGEGGGDPENGSGDRCRLGLGWTLAACVDELHPEKNEDEEMKTYPVAYRSYARHLFWMLQRKGVWMHG
jgi:hypothetical protein